MRRVVIQVIGAALVFVLAVLLIAVCHQFLVLGTAFLVHSITSSDLSRVIVRTFLSSPVYSELLLKTLGGIDPLGVAVSGSLGQSLHQVSSNLFLDPQYVAPGAVISTVVDGNSTVLSLLVTRGLVEAAFVLLGALLVRTGWHRRNSLGRFRFLPGRGWTLVAIGLFTEAQALRGLVNLTLSPSAPRMRDTGLGFGLSRVLGLAPDAYHALMDAWLPVIIPVVLVLLGFLAASLTYRIHYRVRGFIRPRQPHDRTAMPVAYHSAALVLLTALTISAPWSHGYFDMARVASLDRRKLHAPRPTRVVPVSIQTELAPTPGPRLTAALPTRDATQTPATGATATATAPAGLARIDLPTPTVYAPVSATPTSSPTPSPTVTPTPIGPARTDIRRGPAGMEFHVNGQRTLVTGINYNVNYTGMPEATKRALHRRDMRVLHDAGVNAVIGWGIYDEVTLDVASEFHIGVIMPFELDPQGPFDNEAYRREIKTAYTEFVRRFRSYPAVWGWNPGGDELLHRMDTEQHRTPDKLQAAADLLVDLSVLANSLDPDRISIVKEPRDWYIPYLDVALQKVRAGAPQVDPSRYFVFGLNVYGHPSDVADAVLAARRNAEERLKVGLIVGEYAPFGLARADRAKHYGMIWDEIVADTPNGGFVYVFGPDQPNPQSPNPYDPLRLLVNEFSLLDMNIVPVDDAFNALAARWLRAQNVNITR